MRLALATSGMWRLRDAIGLRADAKVCRLSKIGLGADAIGGWGHKATAAEARQIATRRGLPYIAFEDGFLRSVHPGTQELPLSLVMDRTGIYYDSRQPSDLEAFIRCRANGVAERDRIRRSIDRLRELRLSKYNNAVLHSIDELKLRTRRPQDRVLVIDQTAGDASIIGAQANEETFADMLAAAIAENPGAELLVRVHPETMLGRKQGHFSEAQLESLARNQPSIAQAKYAGLLRLTPEPINPWALLEACSKVYCVSSQLGFEGLMAECEVHSFGMSFYNGWGATVDHKGAKLSRRSEANLEALFAAVYFDYTRYIDHENKCLISFNEAVAVLSNKVALTSRSRRHLSGRS